MEGPKYKIGDSLYCASFETTGAYILCPDCGGTKILRCILFDDSELTIDCQGCSRGCNPPTGYIRLNKRTPKVEMVIISGIEINIGEPIEYKISLSANSYRTFKENELFETEEEADIKAIELAKEYDERERARIDKKEKPTRSWAWHVHYHREQIRDAEKTITSSTDKLNAAKRHVKET